LGKLIGVRGQHRHAQFGVDHAHHRPAVRHFIGRMNIDAGAPSDSLIN
jgi:hypothetical protein